MANTHYATSGLIGAKFEKTKAGTTTAFEGAEFTPGQKVPGPNGTEWIYVQANGAITQYYAVGIDENYQAASLTAAMLDDGWLVGFAQIAFADNDMGWVALCGSNINVMVAASCNADVALYATANAGILDDAVTTETDRIEGIVAVAANSLTIAAAVEVLATNPHGGKPGGGT